MKIEFVVAGQQVVFTRNWFTGSARMTLAADGSSLPVAFALSLGTQLSVSLEHVYKLAVLGKDVQVTKHRPLLFAGFRPQRFVVRVDGEVVAERTGY